MDHDDADRDEVDRKQPVALPRLSMGAQVGLILLQLLGSLILAAFEASMFSPPAVETRPATPRVQQTQAPRVPPAYYLSSRETNPLVSGPEIASLRAQSTDMYSAMHACVTDFDGYPEPADTVQLVIEYSETAPSVYLAPTSLAKTSLHDCLEDAARAHADLTSDQLRYVVFDDVTNKHLTGA